MFEESIELEFGATDGGYRIMTGFRLLAGAGDWAASVLGNAGRVAVVSNPTVHGHYGEGVGRSLAKAGFQTETFLLQDGEKYKNLNAVSGLLDFLSEKRITRSDAVIALGGGVVGDVAGFAASVHMRGIRLLQMPTTLLSMIDSSVGGKTGVNTAHGKNLVGTFHQPSGVLIDLETLRTLDERELASGFYEAVKQGVISGGSLFSRTYEFLRDHPVAGMRSLLDDTEFIRRLQDLVVAQVKFKSRVVGQDEKEDTARTDASSRKILNFGHTTAHALEKVAKYGFFKHGEAVGYGILVAAEISNKLEILSQDGIELLNDVVRVVGDLPDARDIPVDDVVESFRSDKKSIGKTVQWVLLEEIGKPVIVSDAKIPQTVVRDALTRVLSR